MQALFATLRKNADVSKKHEVLTTLRSISSLLGLHLNTPLLTFAHEVGGIDILFQLIGVFDADTEALQLICEVLERLFSAPDAAAFLLSDNVWPALSHGFNNSEPCVRVCTLAALERCARPDTAVVGAASPHPSESNASCPALNREADVVEFIAEGLRDLAPEVLCATIKTCIAVCRLWQLGVLIG